MFVFVLVQPNAQEKFLRIKHAYNTLMSSESRRKYDSGFSSQSSAKVSQKEEDFYGFGKALLFSVHAIT